jgi:two-component sensor histidine kinase
MLHELGTNCVKYGSLASNQGRVTVTWTVLDGMLLLDWVERGGPAIAVTSRRGFGSTLIEQIAGGSGGKAQMIFEPAGVTWKISLRLSAADANAPTAEIEPALDLAIPQPENVR